MKNFYRYTGLLVLGAMFSATLFDAEARADVAPAPVLAQPAKILEQKPVVDCSKSTITGEQLLDMIHTIATHGDLTDVPFLENTLQIKFDETFLNVQNMNIYPSKRPIYQVDSFHGPIAKSESV